MLFEAVKQSDKPTVMDDYQIRFPTLVDDVAAVCRGIADKRVDGNDFSITGIWHWSSDKPMTKYQMATQMAEVFGLPHSHLSGQKEPPSGATCTRPHNAALDCSNLDALLAGSTISAKSFKEAIRECLEPFK